MHRAACFWIAAATAWTGASGASGNTERRVDPASGLTAEARARFRPAGDALRNADARPIVTLFQETSYYVKDAAFISASTGWAVGEPHWNQAEKKFKGTIVKTTNGGDACTAQGAGLLESFHRLHFIDANRGWVAGTNGAVLHTSDGGARSAPRRIPVPEEVRALWFADANVGWAASARSVYQDSFAGEFDDWKATMWKTTDAGVNWVRQTLPDSASLINRIEFIDAQTGWAAGMKLAGNQSFRPQHFGAVYQTADGGRTWREQYVTAEGFTFTAMDFVDASHG